MSAASAGSVPLSEAGLRAALEPLAYRGWPVDRLLTFQQLHASGCPIDGIAVQLRCSFSTASLVRTVLSRAGLIQDRHPNWSDERIDRFVALYNEGHSLAEIGRRMEITKGAAVGQSHRLIARGRIEARPHAAGNVTPAEAARRQALAKSPDEIRQHRTEQQRAKRRTVREKRGDDKNRTIRRRSPEREAKPEAAKRLIPLALNRPLAPRKPQTTRAIERAPYVPPPPKYGRVADCCWPIGTPGTSSFHFCDKPTDPGRPYCHTHVTKAYARVAAVADERARA